MREISIEEMPQGCVLSHDNGQHFTVSSFEDASEIISSLQRMIAAQQSVQRTGLEAYSLEELTKEVFSRRYEVVEKPRR